MSIEGNISRSAAAFRDIVWPAIGPLIGGGELVPVESVSDSEFARRLDLQAGIDAWLFYQKTHMRGLASRVQWVRSGRGFDTFTIRLITDNGNRNTEYRKRKIALTTPGAIRPYLTVQAYLHADTDDLLSAAAARTADVIACVDMNIGREESNGHGGRMWVVPWAQLAGAGGKVIFCPRAR